MHDLGGGACRTYVLTVLLCVWGPERNVEVMKSISSNTATESLETRALFMNKTIITNDNTRNRNKNRLHTTVYVQLWLHKILATYNSGYIQVRLLTTLHATKATYKSDCILLCLHTTLATCNSGYIQLWWHVTLATRNSGHIPPWEYPTRPKPQEGSGYKMV